MEWVIECSASNREKSLSHSLSGRKMGESFKRCWWRQTRQMGNITRNSSFCWTEGEIRCFNVWESHGAGYDWTALHYLKQHSEQVHWSLKNICAPFYVHCLILLFIDSGKGRVACISRIALFILVTLSTFPVWPRSQSSSIIQLWTSCFLCYC